MIYNLLAANIHKSHVANLFHYITFRSSLAILLSLVICLLIGPSLIRYCKLRQKYGQPIRSDGPESHHSKAGTPTMGGIMIIISIIITALMLADLTNPYVWITLFALVSFSSLGFIDDYTKITKNSVAGLSRRCKLSMQMIASLITGIALQHFAPLAVNTHLAMPFFKHVLLDLNFFYLPFAVLVITGSSNAVNFTDGLDGLAAGPIAIAAGAFSIISYLVGNNFYAHYLQLIYIPQVAELSVICGAIVGASLGFLWFNAQPAEIFMGDTGSLGLGGVLGTLGVITKHEIVLSLIGGLFVLETLSVIIQIGYFRATKGKRILRMAPLHHHFEKLGWPESKIVIRFWIIAVIFALIGLSSLKLR